MTERMYSIDETRTRRCDVQVLLILYKSALSVERVTELFAERATRYQAVPGLLQKFYVRDPLTGEVGGVYIFDSKESVERFRGSDLEKSIQTTYQFTERPSMRTLDVVQVLHERASATNSC